MPLYSYKGINAAGKSTSGMHEADTPKSLRQQKKRDGVVVTSFTIKKGKGGALGEGKGLSRDVHFDMLNRVKKTDVAGFTRHMSTLLRAGIPLAESLGALFEQTEAVKLKSIVGDVKTRVNEGSSFADALAKHEAVFDNLYVSMVRAGETAGNLDDVLSRLADFMESAAKLKSKVVGAMIYPAIMALVAVVIMAILMIVVVPEITAVFIQQGVSLPLNTRILVWFSDLFGRFWWLLAAVSIGGFFAFRYWSRSEGGKPVWHGFLLKAPIVGPLIRQIAVARFTRTVGTMLESGVPMLQVLDISKAVLGNHMLQEAVAEARVMVMEGESLAVALKKSGQFPPSVIHMIAVGERTGTLETMLLRVSDSYDSEVTTKLERLTVILEPLMIVLMGGAVAFVVFSILTPLMEMQGNMTSM